MNKPIFIAEPKVRSPYESKKVSKTSYFNLLEKACRHGDWISIHDEALWGGDFNSISFARKLTDKPILAKGIHGTDDDIQRALDHGANYVLVLDRIPAKKYWIHTLFEFSDLSKIKPFTNVIGAVANLEFNLKFVYNSRNLFTGEPRYPDQWTEYRNTFDWLCQASNIYMDHDIKKDADAYIVGSNLEFFIQQH